jgi:hypothetical protein
MSHYFVFPDWVDGMVGCSVLISAILAINTFIVTAK